MRTDLMSKRPMNIKNVVIIVLAFVTLLSVLFLSKEQTPKDTSSTQIAPDRASSRLYVKDLHRYDDVISANTRTNIEKFLYRYTRLVGGNDLYTGTIREGTYTLNRTVDGSYDLEMVIDTHPIELSYKVFVLKNSSTDNKEAFYFACMPKSDQKNKDITCVDESGR